MLCKDLDKQLKLVQSIVPKVYATGDSPVQGTALDRGAGGYGAVAAYFNIGAVASSGLFTPSIEESADNVTFAPTTNLSTALANTAQNTPQETAYLGSKRYVRAVATYVSGTSVAIAAVLIGARGALPS